MAISSFLFKCIFFILIQREEFLTALRKQRICYETSVENVEAAKALMDLILLSLYTLFPPTRALEIRSLKLFIEDGHTNFLHQQEGNYLVLKTNGQILIQYYTYKTARTYGRDITMIEVIKSSVVEGNGKIFPFSVLLFFPLRWIAKRNNNCSFILTSLFH